MDHLFVNPYITAARAAELLEATLPTARQAIRLLVAMGILDEITGRSWRRLYLARPIFRAIAGEFD